MKPTFVVRSMLPIDLPAVMTLWRDTEGVGLSPDEDEAMLTRYLERNRGLSLVAEDSGGRLAGAVLAGHDGRRAFLYHLAVRRDCRGGGIGRALAEGAVERLRPLGVGRANIMVYADNPEGRAFWEHLGWRGRDDLRPMQIVL